MQKYVAVKYHRDEGGPDNDMEAMEPGRNVEGPAVHSISHAERRYQIFHCLKAGKVSAQCYGYA